MTTASPLRIVHLDSGRGLRGGQRQLLRLARGLGERGHPQLLVCPEGSAFEGRAVQAGLNVFALPAHDPGHAHGLLQLRQYLRTRPHDILHAHDGRAQTWAWLASAGMPVRRVASRRVTFLPADSWSYRLKYTRTCHAVIAISEYIRQLILRAGVPEGKIELIPDGIEIPLEVSDARKRAEARRRWGLGENEFVLGHLGAFTQEKGQDVALEAFALLAARLPEARLLLAGDGPTRTSPQIAGQLARAANRAPLCGEIENLDEFFPALDLFLMPSRAEGLGSAALHAMAHGLPVIASRVGGLPEIVVEGETGWLVPADSPGALAEAILSAQADRERLRQFGMKARERARQFSTDIMLDRTEALYRRLLAR
jgi:glycosyltransferase involved in cell wall biosynthesis